MRCGVKYRLLAIDLDGTLLDREHQVPAENRAALHRAHEAGLRIVLCTGRAFTETLGVTGQIGLDLDATVSVFGALVTHVATGKTIASAPIPLDIAHDVTAWFQQRDYPVCWLTDADAVGHDGYVIDGSNRHPAVDAWVQRTPCQVACVPALPADAAPPLRLSIIDEGAVLDALSPDLEAAFAGRLRHNVLHAPPYKLSLIEAFAPHVSKWLGVEMLCRAWEIDPAATVAVGDDVNDIDMIRSAGLGVAMANAKPPVHAVADRTTDGNDAGGVAKLIDELLGG
jgi:HAD superfamily hydrolase (TIGR01484 family)